MTDNDHNKEQKADVADQQNDTVESSADKKQHKPAVAQKAIEQNVASENNPPPSKKTNKAKKSIAGTIALWLSIVIIAGLLAVAYFAWMFWGTQNNRIEKLESQLKEQSVWFAQSTSQQSSLLEQQQQRLETFRASLDKDTRILQQRLDTHAQRLQTLTGVNRDQWVLEEVRYLLRLANQRQLTGGGVVGIVGLLESADSTLRDLDVPDLFPIRESIRKDILALQVAPAVDREGLYLQLQAVANEINQLPPVPLKRFTKKVPQEISQENTTQEHQSDTAGIGGSIWGSIKSTLGQLDRYVRVQTHDKPLQPLVSQYQQQTIQYNLQLMLEQAQLALLKEEQVIYQQSLEKIVFWLDKHYGHFPQKAQLVKQIVDLQTQSIVSVLPDISASLLRINDYLQYQKSLGQTPNNGQAVENAPAASEAPQETAL